MMASPAPAEYPVSLTVDAAEGDRNRATCAFRLFLAIPILVVVGTVGAERMHSPAMTRDRR